MQDMTPPKGDRSIRNAVPITRRDAPPHRTADDVGLDLRPPHRGGRRNLLGNIARAFSVIAACVVLGLLLSTLFEGATVTVHPKKQTLSLDGRTLTASPNATVGNLTYQTVSITQSATTSVTTTKTAHVAKQAIGVITVYSNDTTSRRLIKNTRFAAPDGKIYRLKDSVVVPAATKSTDGATEPGSVIATIYADAAGDEYNRTDGTQFTIPDFMGTPRYKLFSALSQGPIAGGFIGEQPVVAPADMTAAETTLKQTLDASLLTSLAQAIPQGSVEVTNSTSETYANIAQTQGSDMTVLLSQSATATVAIVNASQLASVIATSFASDYHGEPIALADPSSATLSEPTGAGPVLVGPIDLSLGGSATLVWQFDQSALKTALLGKDKTDFATVVSTFKPAVDSATLSLRPFWKKTIPTSESKLFLAIQP